MECPKCGYVMEPLDTECKRCRRMGATQQPHFTDDHSPPSARDGRQSRARCMVCGEGGATGVCSSCSRIACSTCSVNIPRQLLCLPCADVSDDQLCSDPLAALRAAEAVGHQAARIRPKRLTRRMQGILRNVAATVHALDAEGAKEAAQGLRERMSAVAGAWRAPVPAVNPEPSQAAVADASPDPEQWKLTREVLSDFSPLYPVKDGATLNAVHHIARRAGIPTPTLWAAQTPVPNACAVGLVPADSHVVVTSGLRNLLPPPQLHAVLGHEVAHISLGHCATNTVLLARAMGIVVGANVLAGIVELGFLMDDSPGNDAVGLLIGLGIRTLGAAAMGASLSRSLQRAEFSADAEGARINGGCGALAQALDRMERSQQPDQWHCPAASHATHAFIVTPGVAWSLGARRHASPNSTSLARSIASEGHVRWLGR